MIDRRKDERGEVMSIWIPASLRERLDEHCFSHPNMSRSRYVCSAIREFIGSEKLTLPDPKDM